MKIGLDFDGVISDCGKLKSDSAKKLYGLDIPPEKFKKEIVIGEGYMTAEQYRTFQKIIYGTLEFGLLMEPVAGMLEYVPRLLADGHSILIVTSRDENEIGIPREWLQKQGLMLNLIGTGFGKSKASACRDLDVYIDDDFDKLEPLVDIVPHRFLFSWGYNSHINVEKVAKRIGSWKELYTTIGNL